MAENVPPGQNVFTTNPTTDTSTRGVPYYEKLRRDLRDTLHKKRMLDKNLEALETKLEKFEEKYLEETISGNIIRGFDNYIKGTTTAAPGQKKKAQVLEADRVFSRSSASFVRDSPTPSSAQTTPSHAPTPTSSFAPQSTAGSAAGSVKNAGNTKKHKKSTTDKGDKDTEDEKPAKRYKISYGRD